MNQYFTKLRPSLANKPAKQSKSFKSWIKSASQAPFSLQKVSPLKVLECIHNLDCSKATGFIPPSDFDIYQVKCGLPYLNKGMTLLEQLQRRATKFILNDYSSQHQDRLVKLNLLPVNYWHEYKNLIYLHKYLNEPSSTDAFRYVSIKVASFLRSEVIIDRKNRAFNYFLAYSAQNVILS